MTPARKMTDILTVDVEDWFHICGVARQLPRSQWSRLQGRVEANTLKILDLLDRYKIKATFFVLGWVARHHGSLIREIDGRGHEIATHGYHHRRVYTQTPVEFRLDIDRSLEALAPLVSAPIKGYRAPEWSIRDDSLWALEILAEAGLCYDASMAPLPVIGNLAYPQVPHRRNTRQGKLWEVPPLVGRMPRTALPLGGGWGLRVFPKWLIRYAIERQHLRGAPAVLFLHPQEFDSRRPEVGLPFSKRFVTSARVERTEKRMHWLLARYTFGTVSRYLEQKKVETNRGTHYFSNFRCDE